MSETTTEDEQVTVLAADLRALLNAADTDYLSTENLPGLEERIDRLAAAVGLGGEEENQAAASAGIDYLALTGQFWLVVTRKDGTEERGYPALKADGSWTYYVPAGVRLVGTARVQSGDTVWGKIDASQW